MPGTAFIGIGSNLGSPLDNCRASVELLAAHPGIDSLQHSSYYESEPFGKTDQEWFINAVAKVQTRLDPSELLEALLDVEKKMGRERKEKWGPRLIDLDLLFYDDRVLEEPGLILPHPGTALRRFVLVPLCEIAEDFMHPVHKKTVRDLLNALEDSEQTVRRIASS